MAHVFRMGKESSNASGLNDRTMRTMQFLTDLLALQSSAKDLLAPEVASILGR
jgi:hypothetical protein